MRVTRSVLEHTVRQCVNTVKGLHADVARMHCRMLVTERMLKDQLHLTDDDLNNTVKMMVEEENAKKAGIAPEENTETGPPSS